MKKVLVVLMIFVVLIAGGAWYMLSGAGDFIKAQIEQQGSKYLGTSVSVVSVDLAIADGKLTINDIDIENPKGYSQEDAISIQGMTLDLGDISAEPYTVQLVSVAAPEVLFEVDADGQGNLVVLKNNLETNLPTTANQPETDPNANAVNPLVIVENVKISDVRLKLDFSQLETEALKIDKKVYEITLPTFNAGSIGKPNGIPADQVGIAIANAMLKNIISESKKEVKNVLKEQAKKKLEEEKAKLLDKAGDKLKGLFNE